MSGYKFHGGLLQRRHRGRRETSRQAAQRSAAVELAERLANRAARRSGFVARFRRDDVGDIELHGNFALVWKLNGPIEIARPDVLRAAL